MIGLYRRSQQAAGMPWPVELPPPPSEFSNAYSVAPMDQLSSLFPGYCTQFSLEGLLCLRPLDDNQPMCGRRH